MMPVELRHSMSGHIFNIQDDGTLVEMNEKPFGDKKGTGDKKDAAH